MDRTTEERREKLLELDARYREQRKQRSIHERILLEKALRSLETSQPFEGPM